MITHTAFDWLFRHALLSIKTSTSFLKGSNRGIANHKYAVRRAPLKCSITLGPDLPSIRVGVAGATAALRLLFLSLLPEQDRRSAHLPDRRSAHMPNTFHIRKCQKFPEDKICCAKYFHLSHISDRILII